MALTAPHEAAVVTTGEEGGTGDAKPDFLAFHVAAGEPERGKRVVAVAFGGVANDHACYEQHAHCGEDGPALALVADHAAEHVGERGADREDRDHLHEVRERGRVFERVRRVGVEKAAAVGAEHLDRNLRSDRADGDCLLRPFERRCVDVGTERLRHPLPDQKQSEGNANRNEDVERAAGDIDPEIAHRARGVTRKAADQRDRQHDAGGGREIILMREPEHLHQVRHRAFAAVVLPVGVSDEARRRIERQVRGHGGLIRRVQREYRLQAHERVKNDEAAHVEEQHGDGVGEPVLFAGRVHARDTIKHAFDRSQDRREERALAVEHARHVPAERLHQRNDDRAVQDDLNPAVDGHGMTFQNRSGRSSAQVR
jgi:hypothetical protein